MTTLRTGGECHSNDPNNLCPIALESLRFPLDSSIRIVFTGYFNGFNVEVKSVDESTLLYHMGCFGKGSVSRSKPQSIQTDDGQGPSIMRKRQYLKRNYWCKKFANSKEMSEADLFLKDIDQITSKIVSDSQSLMNKDIVDLVSSEDENSESQDINIQINCPNISDKQDIVVIVPNSDSEDENYFAALKPKGCINKVRLQEKLILSLQEAFFLAYGLGCLQIVTDNKLLDIQKCWSLFKDTESNFISKYVVYHHFRSKGYIVKPGIKFGGDFLLYKEGPGITHADYIIVIRDSEQSNIQDFVSVLGHIRMANTTVKEILIAEITKPSSELCINSQEILRHYTVREILLNRNIANTINEEVND